MKKEMKNWDGDKWKSTKKGDEKENAQTYFFVWNAQYKSFFHLRY